MKLDKAIVQRRLDLMEAEGVVSYLHYIGCWQQINICKQDICRERPRWRQR